jgi:ppGpp synthetase/RelA/SpoT-type nucleotidyltranferase
LANNGLLREIKNLERMVVQLADTPVGAYSVDPPNPPTAQVPGEAWRPSARSNIPPNFAKATPVAAGTGFGADKPLKGDPGGEPGGRPGAYDPSSSIVKPGPGSVAVPIISGGLYDPALTQGSWAPYRPTPEPKPYPLQPAYPTAPLTGTASWGASGTPITAGFLLDLGEYNPAIYGQPAVALYEKMRRSIAQVWATLRAAKQPQFSAEWAVKPGTKPDEPGFAKAQEIADFVRDNLFGGLEFATSLGSMANQSWGDVIYNALLMLDFGASCHEENWTIDGKFIKLRNLPARLPLTFYRWHALALDTPIPTPSGWKTMQTIQVGDEVFGPDGAIEHVTGKSEVFKGRPCYRVVFRDGSEIIADADHRWKTQTWYERNGACCPEWRRQGQIRTTEEIYRSQNLSYAPERSNHSIDVCQPVQYREKELPVDPKILGYWLGNGGSYNGYIYTHVDDAEEVKAACEAAGYPSRILDEFTSLCRTVSTTGLRDGLRKAGVYRNKHVPHNYLTASVAQRRALLAGLMDTDGSVDDTGRCTFTNCNKLLIDGVAELARSLGEIVHVKGPFSTQHYPSNGTRKVQPGWLVEFSAIVCPFGFSRKVERFNSAVAGRKRDYHHHYIVLVEAVESRDTVCIRVTGDSHLFLAGRSYVQTHNTEADGETMIALEQYGYRGFEFINASIPVNKICRFTYNQEGGNFWGISMQRPMYTSWYVASGLYRVTAIAAERTGCGVPVITLQEGFSEQDRLAAFNFVTQLSAHEMMGMVLAPNQNFKIHGVEGQNYPVLQLIEHHLRQISMVGLQAFMTIGSAPHGSRATASVQHGFFMAASQHLADDVAENITKTTIRRLVQLNFGPDAPVPHLMASNLKAEDDSVVMQQLVTLAQAGLVLSEDNVRSWIRNSLDLPEEGTKGLVLPKGETTEDEPGSPGSPGGPPGAALPGQNQKDSEFVGAQKQGIKVNVQGRGNQRMFEIHRGSRYDQAFREMPEGNRTEAIAHLWRAEVYNSLGEDREFSCERISEALATFGAKPLTQVETYWIANGGAREFLGETAPVMTRGRQRSVLHGGKYETEERRELVARLYRHRFSEAPQILYLSSRFERLNESLREAGALPLSAKEQEWIRWGGINVYLARNAELLEPEDAEPEPQTERLLLGDAGRHVTVGGRPVFVRRPSEKKPVLRALTAYKPITGDAARLALRQCARVAKAVDGQCTDDNAPFDVIAGKDAINVRTLVDGGHDQVTVLPEAAARKERYADEQGLTPHTIVVDARGSKPAYYHRAGVGTFAIASEQPVVLNDLQDAVAGKSLKKKTELLYDPNQPRDERGRFGSGDGKSSEAKVHEYVESYREMYKPTVQKFTDVVGRYGKVESRMKEESHVLEKMQRKGKTAEQVRDIIGMRVTTSSLSDTEKAMEAVKQNYSVTKIDDKIEHPTDLGYRAIHVDVEIEGKPVEIQIRTERESQFGNWAHHLIYKGGLASEPEAVRYAQRVSAALFEADRGGKLQLPECPPPVQPHCYA